MGDWNPLLLSFSCIILQLLQSCAYDIGCIWPRKLMDDNPIAARVAMSNIIVAREDLRVSSIDASNPVIGRLSLYMDGCASLCLAYHDPDVLDPFTMEPTFVTVPNFGQNAYSITLCHYQCLLHIYKDSYVDATYLSLMLNANRVRVTLPAQRQDILIGLDTLYNQNSDTLIMEILEADDYNPYTMGHVVGFSLEELMSNDGFNAKGDTEWCPVLQQEVNCTATCRRFQDTVGYDPVPDPRIHTYLSTDSNKYNCTGSCRHWQPNQRLDSEVGTIVREEFAVPHIGTKAKTYLRDTSVTLEDPNYNYYEEALAVVERLKETSSDHFKKIVIDFFHENGKAQKNRSSMFLDEGKGFHGIRNILQDLVLRQIGYSYQAHTLLGTALSVIEYETLIHVWREKVHHDLVRPTTVIKQWGDDILDTFGGDPNFNGSKNISARDFETFKPYYEYSAEFPSEMSCYCTTLMEFLDLHLSETYGETLQNIKSADSPLVFADMAEFRDFCGKSEMWAGFHFPASVAAGEEKCSGLGAVAAEYLKNVTNGSTFNGGGWKFGDTVPECPRPTSAPTSASTSAPSSAPTSAPTSASTSAPSSAPTSAPTSAPASAQTSVPTSASTSAPSSAPTSAPTSAPASAQTSVPTTDSTTNGNIFKG